MLKVNVAALPVPPAFVPRICTVVPAAVAVGVPVIVQLPPLKPSPSPAGKVPLSTEQLVTTGLALMTKFTAVPVAPVTVAGVSVGAGGFAMVRLVVRSDVLWVPFVPRHWNESAP